MKTCRIFNQKCFLGIFNLLLMACGIVVLMTGFFLFTDSKRLLLSSLLIVAPDEANPLKDLKQPLFLYVAFALTILGMVIVTITFIGYWTAMLNNCCLLTFYFILILMLLLFKFAVCVVIAIWPQCLGLNMNATEMVKVLQGSYGVPGKEQYTVAMDFAQTFLDCCAINDSINYDTSLWRLQKFGKRELTVPVTCCALMNKFEENSYLDPIAVNETLCQSLEPRDFQKGRHLEGCLDKIEYWYREHYIILLCGGLVLTLVEFFVLLSIVISCTRIKQKRMSHRITPVKFFDDEQASSSRTDSIQKNTRASQAFQEDFVSVTPELRESYVQPNYRKTRQQSANFSVPGHNNYRLTNNGYLI